MNRVKSKQEGDKIKIAQWTISDRLGVLTSPGGKSLILEPRLARLLYLLALNEGSIISRQYLIDQIWQETIVNEESLTRAIADLRKILSKHFDTPPMIQTLRKRGYQLNLKDGPRAIVLKWKVKKKHVYSLLGAACTVLLILWLVA